MDKRFAGLEAFEKVRKYTFYLGLCIGSFFMVLAMLGMAYLYRLKKFGGWRSPKASRAFSTRMSRTIEEYKSLKSMREYK